MVNDAMYRPQRGRIAGQRVEPYTSAGKSDLKWFVERNVLVDNLDAFNVLDVATHKRQLNTIIIQNNSHLSEPFKMDVYWRTI
jgi:hypothetical protein